MGMPIVRRAWWLMAVPIILVLLVPAPAAHAASYSLFGRTPAFTHLNGLNIQVSADSRYVVFIADLESDNVDELYSVVIDGGTPVKLNAALAPDGDVRQFKLSGDGSYVFYIADQEIDNRNELYSVAIGGGTPVKLNAALVAGGNVMSFRISPDDSRIVYCADQQANDVLELYSVPAADGTPKKLNATLTFGGDVDDRGYEISPDSDYVVYRADQEVDARSEIYSVPIDDGAVTKLNGALASNGRVDYFLMHPIINVVVYTANEGNGYELFSVPIGGGVRNRLSGPPPAGKRVASARISPNGSRVIYEIAENYSKPSLLYSVLIGGGAASLLTPPALADGGARGFQISADSGRVVFLFNRSAAEQDLLYSVAMKGTERVLLHSAGADHWLSNIIISSDSDWVVFSDNDDSGSQYQVSINAVPIGGGTSLELSQTNERAFDPLISPDNGRVIYRSFVPSAACTETELTSVQIFGGGRRNLTLQCGSGGSVDQALFSSEGQRIVYSVTYRAEGIPIGSELFISDGQVAQRRVFVPMARRS